MSPTHKPKPPDKGAPPEHKPSRKVALEEVMRSLQDLVSNELSTEPEKQPGEPTANASRKTRVAGKQPAATTASPQETEATTAGATADTESITLESLPDVAATIPSIPEPHAPPEHAIPAGGLQQELPYLDPLSSVPSVRQPSTAPTDHPPAGATTDTDNDAPPDVSAPSMAEAVPPPPEDFNWDDIPVLDEAVDLLEGSEANETGHAAGGPASVVLPPADAARRLAIQVAARLNVELRKSGQAGLSSDIITRLARLLQEALAKGAPNMENTTTRDGGSTERGAVPAGTNAGAVFRPPPDKH